MTKDVDSMELRMRGSDGRIDASTRMVLKNGRPNLKHHAPAGRGNLTKILHDYFHTVVDARWRWTILCFCTTYFSSWLLFAGFWWFIAYAHGDLEPEHLPENQEASGWVPCVWHIKGFTSCFLYSFELQHTTGFGIRMTSEKCPDAVFLTSAQSIVGVILEAFTVGVIFTKIARPKKRAETLVFSDKAVICPRDGRLTLQLRVADTRSRSRIVEAHATAVVVRRRVTAEGEELPHDSREATLGTEEEAEGKVLLAWPATLVHRIDERSPFYAMSAEDLVNREEFELVVVLEGIVETTGLSIQARASYLPNEILWGHRLPPVLTLDKKTGAYTMDESQFHETVPADTPLCSMKEIDESEKASLSTADI